MDSLAQERLAGALGLGTRGVLALVGAGGKTTALHLIGAELAAAGCRVITTTTTAMLLDELADVGPLFLQAEDGGWADGLEGTVAAGQSAAVAHSKGDGGKVVGLSTVAVDALWASRLADCLVVEADGSRGLPFKAFGPHEPQVPSAATTIVDVAGLDALGVPLTDAHVHRADVLAAILKIPLGSEVTARVMADGLRAQVVRLRRAHTGCRIVVLLNKADLPDVRAGGRDVARDLLGCRGGEPPRVIHEGRPDCVVVGSLLTRRFEVEQQT